jgi:methionyl-tRNA formyltransferase
MKNIKRVLFMGSKQLGLRVLQEMHASSPETLIGAVTIDDSKDTRTKFNSFVVFCEANKLPLHVAKNRRHSEEILQNVLPELCLVVGWYWLISKATLDKVPAGIVGIHNSLLPKYRGSSPLVWQVINNEKEAGFSLFSFTPGMDDGPILAQGSVEIREYDYIANVLDNLETKVIDVLRGAYPEILRGTLKPVEQNHQYATYCAQRFPRDGKIDWHMPARDVYNFIRAQSDPYPGAFTFLHDDVLVIRKARLFEPLYHGTPGQVARIANEGVYVICGDRHAIVLEEVELQGRRGNAAQLVKSVRFRLSSERQSVGLYVSGVKVGRFCVG